jgi:hypothetical protein
LYQAIYAGVPEIVAASARIGKPSARRRQSQPQATNQISCTRDLSCRRRRLLSQICIFRDAIAPSNETNDNKLPLETLRAGQTAARAAVRLPVSAHGVEQVTTDHALAVRTPAMSGLPAAFEPLEADSRSFVIGLFEIGWRRRRNACAVEPVVGS